MDLTLNQLLFRTSHEKSRILQPVREKLRLGRGQPRVISYLLKHGSATQNDIAEYLGIDPASVSRMTEILRKNGFLTRTADEGCRRANKLELTGKGRAAAEEWELKCNEVEQKLLEGFSSEETELLKSLLHRLLDNMTRKDSL